MTRYEIACDKRITLTAIVLEVLMLISCILLADAVNAELLKNETMLASHVSFAMACAFVGVLQYLIVSVECIARFRDDTRGLTLPLAWLPGGIIVRSVLVYTLSIVVICMKLIIYFLSVMFTFLLQILHVDKKCTTSGMVDIVDRVTEPVERLVNSLYNLLYYHKIRKNTSVFTSIFNGSLSFWCINH